MSRPLVYVLAVSGGVDSVVLLDIMARQLDGHGLVVAHFDHGIRDDSADDRQFVGGLAAAYGLPFRSAEGRLGVAASEAAARRARYDFLHGVRRQHDARAVVTAHHRDDVLETAVLNLLRGSGRKGLSSLQSTDGVMRPLLTTPKAHILAYARKHGLRWREDSTNSDTAYLRNHIRHNLLPRLSAQDIRQLHDIVARARLHNRQIDSLLEQLLAEHTTRSTPAEAGSLDRQWFIMLPHAVAREVMAAWLRSAGVRGFDRRGVERLVLAAKTYAPGKRADVNGRWQLLAGRQLLALTEVDR